MSYNSDLQENNEELQAILNTVNALPDANSSGYSTYYADAEIPYPIDEGVNFFVAMSKLSNEGAGIKEGDLVISSNGTLCKVTLVQQEYSRVNCFPLASIADSGGDSDVLVVTVTDNTASHSPAEIGEAYSEGKAVFLVHSRAVIPLNVFRDDYALFVYPVSIVGTEPNNDIYSKAYRVNADKSVSFQSVMLNLPPYPTDEDEGKVLTAKNGDFVWSEHSGGNANEPDALDLPRIFFTGEFPGAKSDGEYSVLMEYISRTKRFTSYATAKVQGSSSTTFTKKNYTFKLYKDAEHTEKMKVSFRNWPQENKFVAKANTIDRTHARNIVSCRIWGDMVKSRVGYDYLPAELRESPNMGAIDGFAVQIYLNGVYQGLYTWNIPKDDWMAGINSDLIDSHAIICAEGATKIGQNGDEQCSFNVAYPDTSQVINGYDWSDETDTVGNIIRTNFKAFSDLVVNGTDSSFKENIETYMNLESLIDTFIFVWVACGVDSLGKNQFMYTYNAGLPWYSGVYDLDSTWGLAPEGSRLVSYDTVMQDDYVYPSAHGLYNKLYERIWKLYPNEVRGRWNTVKNDALSITNIINHFEAFHDAIPVELFAEDSAETTADGRFVTTINSTNKGFDSVLGVDKNNIQQIRNFAAKRWAYVDNQINLIECEGITLSETAFSLTEDNAVKILTATLLPTNCNESVTWSSDNENVAVVSGGTVTAINNGSCNITAICGDYSATCVVNVSGFATPGSENLADPSSSDWMKGYELEKGNPVSVGMPDITVTNFIEIKHGDVFTFEGCQALYGKGGYARISLFDVNKKITDEISTYTMESQGYATVKNRVTTLNFAKEFATYFDWTKIVYVRFILRKFDNEEDINTDNIVILRNPNGENADAWA